MYIYLAKNVRKKQELMSRNSNLELRLFCVCIRQVSVLIDEMVILFSDEESYLLRATIWN